MGRAPEPSWPPPSDPPVSRRAYEVRRLVTVAPVTTRVRGIPVEVALGPKDGMPRECVVNLDTVTTIPKDCGH